MSARSRQHRQRYLGLLRKLRSANGRQRLRLRRQAAKARRLMIAANDFWHPEDEGAETVTREHIRQAKKLMPSSYRNALGMMKGMRHSKAALAKYRQFWGLAFPPEISLHPDGEKKLHVVTGLGRSPKVILAPERGSKQRRVFKGRRVLAYEPGKKRLMIFDPRSRKPIGKGLRFAGYAVETHYIPTPKQEKAGTFKSGKYWVHKHDDDGGTWPPVYKDSAGNFIYGKGTYTVDRWLRR